jgi:hypothetical protein
LVCWHFRKSGCHCQDKVTKQWSGSATVTGHMARGDSTYWLPNVWLIGKQ